ncbi:MAG: CheR family methyltransferase [Gammaproteobacteria bacterium]
MNRTTPPSPTPGLLHQFSDSLSRQMGLYFPAERWPDLMRGMAPAARNFGIEELSDCMKWLLSKPLGQHQIEILARHLTVGETYFFRDPRIFDALQQQILPPLIRQRRKTVKRLRLWSAGCSTGEEAYSLAILLHRMIPDHRHWDIIILGTDINPHALRKASAGIYGGWSFRSEPPWLRESYFLPLAQGKYQLSSLIRSMVTFSYFNLAANDHPPLEFGTGSMDIILCRNVLMYFEPEQAARVILRYSRSLSGGGWLIVNPGDVPTEVFAHMEAEAAPGLSIYRKKSTCHAWPGDVQFPDLPETTAACDAPRKPSPQRGRRYPAVEALPGLPPEPSVASCRQDLLLLRHGRYGESVETGSQCIADESRHSQAMTLMARIHANRGELATAQDWCERAIALDRTNPQGYYLLALVLLEQDRTEESILALKRTLYLDPDFVMAHFTLANLYLGRAGHHQAGIYFANALSLLQKNSPDDVPPESEGMCSGRLIEIIHSIAAEMSTC